MHLNSVLNKLSEILHNYKIIDNWTIIVGDFNTSFTVTDKATGKKINNKNTKDLSNPIIQLGLSNRELFAQQQQNLHSF